MSFQLEVLMKTDPLPALWLPISHGWMITWPWTLSRKCYAWSSAKWRDKLVFGFISSLFLWFGVHEGFTLQWYVMGERWVFYFTRLLRVTLYTILSNDSSKDWKQVELCWIRNQASIFGSNQDFQFASLKTFGSANFSRFWSLIDSSSHHSQPAWSSESLVA